MAEAEQGTARRGAIMVQDLPVGARVRLRGGIVAEVTGNPRDGGWIFVRYVSCPGDPSKEGAEELAFCIDVLDVL
jgi:hypothetical protein